MATFDNSLRNMSTPDDLRLALMARLTAWRTSTPLLVDPTWAPALRNVIQCQDAIGWKSFLEGLPTKALHQYITTHFPIQNTCRTASPWLAKLLQAAHILAWSQWEHRNIVLHQTDQPRQRKAEQILNTLIVSELTTGPLSLPPADYHYFHQPLGHLLFQSLPFRQAWYSQVTSARLRHQR